MATKLGNGKTVQRSGNLPDARMGKAAKIHDNKRSSAKVARVHNMIGGVVHATSHNYGQHGAKARELHSSNLGAEDKD